MSDMTNRQRVLQFIDAFERGDRALQLTLVDPDVVFHSPESLPYGGKWCGIAGWQEMKAAIARVWSDLSLTISSVIGAEDSDCFAIIATLKVTAADSGKSYQSEVMEQWHWRDGLLVYVRPYYWDTAKILELTV